MACNCGGSRVAYAVRLKDGTVPKGSPFATSQEARQVMLASGGGSMKPVPKPGPVTSGPRA